MAGHRPVAVIIGATGGIGRAVADGLADRYTLWLAGRDEAALKTMAAAMPDACHWTIDLAAPEDTGVVVPGELTSVDLLVHCAGVFERDTIHDMPERKWREVFAVNLFGVVEVTRNLLPGLRAAQGRVIVVNSTVVTGAPAGRAAYAASKQALRVFAEALHTEELGNGVRVTSIYPGRVATGMQRAVRRTEGGPFQPDRYLAPESVASAVFSVLSAPPDAHLTEFVLQPVWHRE
ncbi:SDR family oxidoreductase [Amycolatopsis sp. K13G38]|uniref:SDR family oxidoreductase n=1 Tax=Amycolatopsis acididurans TaxID=2724524 RepID=A0ABX1J1Q0_9PSEU|nr:SDR family oxidoreductase [Amycolatopsis acididurans]NKQ52207.1 SDR family oxidoreductase [Amycolatopsis acididurans]